MDIKTRACGKSRDFSPKIGDRVRRAPRLGEEPRCRR
jgi:hypothetical protein